MFRKGLIALAAMGLLLVTGILVPSAQARAYHHHCQLHHGQHGWHKHHHGHLRHWGHYCSHRKFRRDPDFNYHPEYGWGYYNDPASNWVRPGKSRRVAHHCHIKKHWRHGHLVRGKHCHKGHH